MNRRGAVKLWVNEEMLHFTWHFRRRGNNLISGDLFISWIRFCLCWLWQLGTTGNSNIPLSVGDAFCVGCENAVSFPFFWTFLLVSVDGGTYE